VLELNKKNIYPFLDLMLTAKTEEQTKARKRRILTTSILRLDELTPKTAVPNKMNFRSFSIDASSKHL
jgi:hypothetical protein